MGGEVTVCTLPVYEEKTNGIMMTTGGMMAEGAMGMNHTTEMIIGAEKITLIQGKEKENEIMGMINMRTLILV